MLMRRTESGLFIARTFSFLKFRGVTKTITLPNGERAKVTVDDSGTVRHVEHGDVLDATVRPASIRLKVRPIQTSPKSGGFARPTVIRTKARSIHEPS
jgi:hypothetical protein